MIVHKRIELVSLIGAVSWFVIIPALPVAAEDVQLETITVTAEKREEDVQKVTTAITVLSDVEIEDIGIQSTQDIWKYIPNLSTSHAGSRDYFNRIKLRGITNTPFGDPAVSVYIDDVSYAGVYAFNSPLYDIDRIEVLKGPQGTLYGKNTEGGAINIVSKAPGDEFEGKVGLEAGDYNKKGINAAITGPLMEDKLFFRLSALKSTRDGYIENKTTGGEIDNQETFFFNAGVLFTPTSKLDFDLRFRLQDLDDNGGFPMVAIEKDRFFRATGVVLDDFQGATNYSGDSSSKSNTTSLRTRYRAESFDLVSVTAYRNMDNESFCDADFTPIDLYLGLNSVGSDSISQELRLQSRDEDTSLKWLLGLYYGKDQKEYETGFKLGKIYAEMMGAPLYAKNAHQAEIDSEDMAVFGQGTIRFFDDALGVTAGLRYEHSGRTLDHTHTFGGMPIVVPINSQEMTNSEFLPKLSLDYRINVNSMVYTSVSRGYKAGGFAYAVDNPELAAFDSEISTAFELGWKNELPELRLRVNAATFYSKIDDYQDRVQYDAMTVLQANVSEADIYGCELEAAYALAADLSINGFVGYTHARYGEYIDPMTGANYEDNAVALIPEYDSGLFLKYRNSWGFFARAGMQHIGSMYFDRTNKKKQGSYTLYNAKIGYERDNWEIYLTAKNLTNEQYFLEGYEDPTIGYVATVGDPRTFYVNFNYRF